MAPNARRDRQLRLCAPPEEMARSPRLVYGACHFSCEPGKLAQNFILVNSARGVSDADVRHRAS